MSKADTSFSMRTERFPLQTPPLSDLAPHISTHLQKHYIHATATKAPCPDLRLPPFSLATDGLSGSPCIAEVGGQANLFPRPNCSAQYSIPELAAAMELSHKGGSLIGAGAGPWQVVGQNCELAASIGWEAGMTNVRSESRVIEVVDEVAKVRRETEGRSALMINLFGSRGKKGDVLKVTAKGRRGEGGSFTECIQEALEEAYGEQTVSLGGVFLVKKGRARYHVMPDFPPEEKLPFKDRGEVEKWLTYHEFDAPMVCLSVLHSADPGGKMALRLEHTHCFAPDGRDAGGHYHNDVEPLDEIEYEGYFNVAEAIYRIDRPT